jgi:hypothetical protein
MLAVALAMGLAPMWVFGIDTMGSAPMLAALGALTKGLGWALDMVVEKAPN